MIIRNLLRQAEQQLIKVDVPESYAKLLMNEILSRHERNLYMEMGEECDSATEIEFLAKLERLCTQEPYAYVVGVQYFYGRPFDVNESVLIPRPETEELVANVLADIDEYFAEAKILQGADIGTGSGAIAISLKQEEPKLKMIATDISETAIQQAIHNAKINDADITFMVGDMLQPIKDANVKIDILVCNPPYIPQNENVEVSVKDFEPHIALFGGEDGLKYYRTVLTQASEILNPTAMIAFEMGWDQKEALTKLAKQSFPEAKVNCYKDIQGKDRMLMVYLNIK